MSFEEEFDEHIRQKSEELKYPFDEKNWEAASRLIDADRRNNPKRGWFRIYSPAILFTLIGIGSIVVIDHFILQDNDRSEVITQFEAPAAVKTHESNALTQNPADNTINSTPAVEQPVVNIENAVAAPEEIQASTAPAMNVRFTKKQTAQAKTTNVPVRNEKVLPVGLQNITATFGGTINEEGSGNTYNNSVPHTEDPGTSNQDENDNTSALVTNNNNETAGLTADRLVPVHFLLPLSFSNSEPSLNIIYAVKDDDYYKPGKAKVHFMNVEAGITYLPGWSSGTEKDGKGLNWYGAVNFGIYLSKNISIGTGLQAYNITNIKKPFHSATSREYGFASVTSQTLVTASSLYYTAVPLKIFYDVDKNNRIGAGINAGYLFGSHNTVNSYDVLDGSNILKSSEKNYGRYDGMKQFNLMLCASYSTNLNARFAINGEFIYGLTDIFDNTNYKKDAEKPLGIRLGIQYTIFNK